MTSKEIIQELREEIILLLNCTDDKNIKEKMLFILNGENIKICSCPNCGETFEVSEKTMKHSIKIL